MQVVSYIRDVLKAHTLALLLQKLLLYGPLAGRMLTAPDSGAPLPDSFA